MDTTEPSGVPLRASTTNRDAQPLELTDRERAYVRRTIFNLVGLDGLTPRHGEPIDRESLDFARRCVAMVEAVGLEGEAGDDPIAGADAVDRLRELVAEEAEWRLVEDTDTPLGVDGRDPADLEIALGLEAKLGIDRAAFVVDAEKQHALARRRHAKRLRELALDAAMAPWATASERASWARTARIAEHEAAA